MDTSTTTGTIKATTEHPEAKLPIAFTRIGRGEIKAEFWACGECGTLDKSEAAAATCCTCSRCGKAGAGRGHYAKHAECKALDEAERRAVWDGEQAVKDARVLLAATPIPASCYSDPVFWGDRFIMDVDEVESDHESSDSYEDGKPMFVFGTTLHALELDADATLETALQSGDMDDEAADRVSREATDALALGLAAWNERFGSTVKSYTEDSSVVVVLDQAGFNEAIEDARELLAELTIAKALCIALYLAGTRESILDFVSSRKPWIQSGWWKLDS